MDDKRHVIVEASLDWKPHPGERETRAGRFSPAHTERNRGGERDGQ